MLSFLLAMGLYAMDSVLLGVAGAASLLWILWPLWVVHLSKRPEKVGHKKVVLAGNSPATLTAGILLLSRSRSFGIPFSVSIVGSPSEISSVEGPAVVHSHVLASCGVGRDLGQGPLVVVPGPPTEPVLMSLQEHGKGDWFEVDSSGDGGHPATKAFVKLVRDNRASARHAAALLRRLCRWAGVPPEPALLDLLFGAPAPPLTRLGLAMRAGQALTGESGQPITHVLVKGGVENAVLQREEVDPEEVLRPGARVT